jgi:16S rRNA G966 N2-methylase RsmD
MRFPGGKNLRATLCRIINQIPPHGCYVELFAGSAAVLRHKRPAACSVAVDCDPGAVAALAGEVPAGTELVTADAIKWLREWAARQGDRETRRRGARENGSRRPLLVSPSPGHPLGVPVFVYADPPYMPDSCSSRLRYEHVLTIEQHEELLDVLLRLTCLVAVSGYYSHLYATRLAGWRSIHWPEITRGGYPRDQWLWMNYPEPAELHDYSFLGENYRERENIARQKRRWCRRLAAMPRLKRLALLATIQEVSPMATKEMGRQGDKETGRKTA